MTNERLRSHNCGALRIEDLSKKVTLSGWIHRRRDHGGLIFIDLRDRFGITQIVFDPDISKELHSLANKFRSEWTLTISGTVITRAEGMANTKLSTGEIEVQVETCNVHSQAKTPPFEIGNPLSNVGEEIRLKYRYLDLRNTEVSKKIILRHKVVLAIRNFFDQEDFIEVTTPILGKPTPEGSRDYIVPSRIHPGSYYALPQSPQIYKQLLMVGGMDKYFQIAPCMRDEDLRSDRQPEFSQLDVEVSFSSKEIFMSLIEKLMQGLFSKFMDVKLPSSFPHMSYEECLNQYGTDKPDLRFDMKLTNISNIAKESNFAVFADQISLGGVVKGITVKGGARFSRKEIDNYTSYVGKMGIRGLAWIKVQKNNELQGGISKFFTDEQKLAIIHTMKAEESDLLLFIADSPSATNQALDHLRRKIAKDLDLIPSGSISPVWVTDFPLFQWDADAERLDSEHHPFTLPNLEDLHLVCDNPEKALQARSSSYDLVINGYELGSGSQRIHDFELQEKVFSLLQLSQEEISEKFGFFVEALQYGTPPHLGIGLGVDRLLMILAKTDNIRDVVAFPKTQRATDLMSQAPGKVDPTQLEELKITPIDD